MLQSLSSILPISVPFDFSSTSQTDLALNLFITTPTRESINSSFLDNIGSLGIEAIQSN